MSVQNRLFFGFGRKLPMIYQTEATECGLACLAMIAGYYGHHVDLVVMRARFPVSLKGCDLRRIMKISQGLELGTRALRLDLDKINQLRLPCILHWNFSHFVVLKEADSKFAVIHDPAQGVRKLPLDIFSNSYTGVALELWPTKNFEQRSPLPRIRLRNLIGSVSGLSGSLLQIIILALALELFALAQPLFLQWVIDEVIVSADRDILTMLLIGFVLLLFFQQITSAVRSWALMYFGTIINVQWRTNVFSHLLNLPVQYFEKRHLGDVVSRFSAVDHIQQTLSTSFLSALIDGLFAIITLIMMFIYSWKLGLAALAAVVLYSLLRVLRYFPLLRATEETIIKEAKQQSHFLETIRGVKTVKLFNQQHDRRDSWLSLFIDKTNSGLRVQKLQLLYKHINGLLFGIVGLLIIWLGARMVLDGLFSVGTLIAFNSYRMNFDGRVSGLIDKYFEVKMLRLQGERLADIVFAEQEHKGDFQYLPNEKNYLSVSISFEDIAFNYADDEPMVLDGVSFSVGAGESVALVGPSGCGKTTLINILLGVLPPTRGKVCLGGVDVQRLGLEQIRDMMGTVLQDDVLFAGTIADNISFFGSQTDLEWVAECAKIAAIHEDISKMPMGYNTLVGDMGAVLSGGQKQRVLLARALYKRPIILVLDEATSHLDIQLEKEINAAIVKLNMTRLIVAHRPETIASASRIIAIGNGKVVLDQSKICSATIQCGVDDLSFTSSSKRMKSFGKAEFSEVTL